MKPKKQEWHGVCRKFPCMMAALLRAKQEEWDKKTTKEKE